MQGGNQPRRAQSRRAAIRGGAVAAGVGALWLVGYFVARRHGVVLPQGHGLPWNRVPELLQLAGTSQLNLEDLSGLDRDLLILGYAALGVAAAASFLAARTRARVRSRATTLAAGAIWFVAGSLPLAVLLPDWNAWRDSVPGLGFGLFVIGGLALASPWLAVAFAWLRLVALILAAPAPSGVTALPPATASDMSFVRIVRLQRVADATRRSLEVRYPSLRPRADVRFRAAPRMSEVAFQGPRALRVWYGDSSLTWSGFGRVSGFRHLPDAVLEYDTNRNWRTVVLEPEAVRLLGLGVAALDSGRVDVGDSLLEASRRAQPRIASQFEGDIAQNEARGEFGRGNLVRADSLNQVYLDWVGRSAEWLGLQAAIEADRGHLREADELTVECLALDPTETYGLRVRRALERVAARAPGPAGGESGGRPVPGSRLPGP